MEPTRKVTILILAADSAAIGNLRGMNVPRIDVAETRRVASDGRRGLSAMKTVGE